MPKKNVKCLKMLQKSVSTVEGWWVVLADDYMQFCEYFMSHAYFIAAAHHLIYCRA